MGIVPTLIGSCAALAAISCWLRICETQMSIEPHTTQVLRFVQQLGLLNCLTCGAIPMAFVLLDLQAAPRDWASAFATFLVATGAIATVQFTHPKRLFRIEGVVGV